MKLIQIGSDETTNTNQIGSEATNTNKLELMEPLIQINRK